MFIYPYTKHYIQEKMLKLDEKAVSYEGSVGERIIEILARSRTKSRFRVNLEEGITHDGNYELYHHGLSTNIYGAYNRLGWHSLSNSAIGHWYNEDQEPLAQIFLAGTIQYLRENYQFILRAHNVIFSEPSLPRRDRGKYTSEFFITAS